MRSTLFAPSLSRLRRDSLTLATPSLMAGKFPRFTRIVATGFDTLAFFNPGTLINQFARHPGINSDNFHAPGYATCGDSVDGLGRCAGHRGFTDGV